MKKPREFWIDAYTASRSAKEDNRFIHVREVLPDDSCPKCEESKNIRTQNVKIDWPKIWKEYRSLGLDADNYSFLQSLVEKGLRGEE